MKTTTYRIWLALLMFAGSSLTAAALAEERADQTPADSTSASLATTGMTEWKLEQAQRAMAESAASAAERVVAATKLDLDIRLLGRTSLVGGL
ncbi:MAG: hypothetical protein WD448_13335 [Woeseia sp.]